jgi:pimeloyl-ACP methyl ester carboxylesterase
VKIAVEGAELFFDVDGAQLVPAEGWLLERPTVLLLHDGPGSDHAPFKARLGPALAAAAQVVYLDFRGHGRSSGDDAPGVDRLADDVAAFCNLLEVERPVVLGRGLGARVASRLALRRPGLAAALVLVGAAGDHVVDAVDVPVLVLAVDDGPAGEAVDEVLRFLAELDAEQAQVAE